MMSPPVPGAGAGPWQPAAAATVAPSQMMMMRPTAVGMIQQQTPNYQQPGAV